jgi:hypothetical protein
MIFIGFQTNDQRPTTNDKSSGPFVVRHSSFVVRRSSNFTMSTEDLRLFGMIFIGVIVVSLLLGTILLVFAAKRVRQLNIPDDADFVETLRLTPFYVVLGIDLLDLGLDFLSVPVVWVILDRMGLKALRSVSAVQAVIPGTQFIPALTACWIGVRLFKIR